MEKITGMKINQEHPSKNVMELPQDLDFYNSEGEVILSIRINQYEGMGVAIYPHGVIVRLFHDEKNPLYKRGSKGVKWVTTLSLGESYDRPVFPTEE